MSPIPVIKNEKLRKALKIIVPFVLIPALLVVGVFVNRGRSYAYISIAVALLSLLFFATGFEKKKTGTRRLIIVAVMTALSVAGRFIPIFKPITALTVITAVYLGGEAGFLVGSLSAVISNLYFGEGPWTPFQMFAWGMIGLAAGFLAKPLSRSKIILALYGAAAGVIYSVIMDTWTVLWYNGSFELSLYLAALATGAPYMLLYAASNVIFLLLFAKPFGEKLERVKIKYNV